jgi:hypothetical protein
LCSLHGNYRWVALELAKNGEQSPTAALRHITVIKRRKALMFVAGVLSKVLREALPGPDALERARGGRANENFEKLRTSVPLA